MKQPEPETRGSEEPGDWRVDAAAAARAAVIKAQIDGTMKYIKENYGQEPCGGGDTA